MTTTTSTTAAVARRYVDAVSTMDFAAVGQLLASDVVWHHPGNSRFSGLLVGAVTVNEMISELMGVTKGTLGLEVAGRFMINGKLFAVPVHFSAKRDDAELSLDGFDVLKVRGDRIVDVWVFAEVQKEQDAL
ncbi:nuclear transport factor 2 family protein [Lentzea roselyniae]|uniref:Nuclear transport factor 2 family protein n=1 Tax=Lentzea roselyniae TaxID=531940 RepID=A0ABP7BYK5_9PSEU